MNVRVNRADHRLSYDTDRLFQRMVSPLCGLDQRVTGLLGSMISPRTVTTGAELSGVHLLCGRPCPPIGSYHIGASGLFLEEALVRTLGESVERYAQMTAEVLGGLELAVSSYNSLVGCGRRVLGPDDLVLFESTAFGRPGFPFAPFEPDRPMAWLDANSIVGDGGRLIPAQFLLVGYRVKEELGEKLIFAGVTTGTAAHRSRDRALLNALLELIQVDAAVGHWYSSWPCHEITLDARVREVSTIITRYAGSRGPVPRFIWLPSPDLPAFSIACLLHAADGGPPAVAVGLGCSLTLAEALYKAWLEAIGVWQLASVNVFQERLHPPTPGVDESSVSFYDLDRNVAYYAAGGGRELFNERFKPHSRLSASDLSPDVNTSAVERVEYLRDAFTSTGKDLYRLDLTTADVASLGFVVERVWCPQTLCLPLPSAPPSRHRRFVAFGGFVHDFPHPYP
jgi:thiazole/oxazole-forming peptide maturase SagD family component